MQTIKAIFADLTFFFRESWKLHATTKKEA
jgi:hypothetical protein